MKNTLKKRENSKEENFAKGKCGEENDQGLIYREPFNMWEDINSLDE